MPRIYSRRAYIAASRKVSPAEEPVKTLYQMTPEERGKLVKLPVLRFLTDPDPPPRPPRPVEAEPA